MIVDCTNPHLALQFGRSHIILHGWFDVARSHKAKRSGLGPAYHSFQCHGHFSIGKIRLETVGTPVLACVGHLRLDLCALHKWTVK